jgi:hypothetical protein
MTSVRRNAAGITVLAPVLDDAGKPIINNAGEPVLREVPKYGLHALRHACASLWIEQGHNPKQIQTLMGHSSIKVTFDVYGHLFADNEADHLAPWTARKVSKSAKSGILRTLNKKRLADCWLGRATGRVVCAPRPRRK